MPEATNNIGEDNTRKNITHIHGSSTDELVDILDEHGETTGSIRTKGEAHSEGLWHKAIHIWIYNSRGEILLQKRAKTKLNLPGLWDTSVAGHVSSGESFEEAAARELHEELGIIVQLSELKKVTNCRTTYDNPEHNYHSRELVSIYLYRLEELPTKLQTEEVDEVRFISIDELERELSNSDTARKYAPWDYSDMINTVKRVLAQ